MIPNGVGTLWWCIFGVFTLFWVFLPPFIVKSAYFGHFGAISRDFGPFLAIYDGSTTYKKSSKIDFGRNLEPLQLGSIWWLEYPGTT